MVHCRGELSPSCAPAHSRAPSRALAPDLGRCLALAPSLPVLYALTRILTLTLPQVVQLSTDGKRARVAIDELLEEGAPPDWVWRSPEVIPPSDATTSSATQIAQPKINEQGAGANAKANTADGEPTGASGVGSGAASGADGGVDGGGSSTADYRLREWWPIRRLRPLPPPPPDEFGGGVQVGDEVNIFVEDAWWDVAVIDSTTHDTVTVEYDPTPSPAPSLPDPIPISIPSRELHPEPLPNSVVCVVLTLTQVRARGQGARRRAYRP